MRAAWLSTVLLCAGVAAFASGCTNSTSSEDSTSSDVVDPSLMGNLGGPGGAAVNDMQIAQGGAMDVSGGGDAGAGVNTAGTSAGGSAMMEHLPNTPEPIALYNFGGVGDVISDVSDVAPALDLNMYGAGVTRITHGIRFDGNDAPIAVSGGSARKIIDSIKASHEVSVEIWLSTPVAEQAGPARLFSMARENHHRNLSILHGPADCHSHGAGAFFQIRVKNADEDNGCDPIVQPAASPQVVVGQPIHFVFSQATDGTQSVYVNGVLSASDVDAEKNFDTFYPDTPLGLGNEPNAGLDATSRDAGRKWIGDLYLVAVYDVALTAEQAATNFALGYENR